MGDTPDDPEQPVVDHHHTTDQPGNRGRLIIVYCFDVRLILVAEHPCWLYV